MSESMSASGAPTAPTMPPPGGEAQGGGSAAVGTSEPQQLGDQQLAAGAASEGDGRPQLQPPGAGAGAAGDTGGAVAATWQTSTVTGLWSINEVRNAWMHAAGAWRKIYNGRDWAFTALVTLAAQARQTGRSVNFRTEADGMVYEIYLW